MEMISLNEIIEDLQKDLSILNNTPGNPDTARAIERAIKDLHNKKTDKAYQFYTKLITSAKSAGVHCEKREQEIGRYILIRMSLLELKRKKPARRKSA